MAATRTQGITIDTDGNFTINKEYRGIRLFFRLGKLGQDQAEQRLHTEIGRVDCELERKAHARPWFAHCAARYLDESRDKRSFDVIAEIVGPVVAVVCRCSYPTRPTWS